ncbi:MAG: phytanoyl-CoA dioxygenase family protein [Planctomycetota bacterium]
MHPLTSSPALASRLSDQEIAQFHEEGYLIIRGLLPESVRETMVSVTHADLTGEVAPVEFEAEVRYPGAPESLESAGGRTVRRLKQAYSRDPVFGEWMCSEPLAGRLQQLFNGQRVLMPLAHHNCVMTKQPRFSSDTLWHQDMRYWAYERPELISVWLGLGEEHPQNGCLWVIPGSHRMSFRPEQFDEALFFRTDLPESAALINTKIPVELQPGDVLFFHSLTFHAASKNYTSQPKFSAVFTFRPADNPPRPGSRSAAAAELLLPDMR